MAKVCERCSAMYTEASTMCSRDGTPLSAAHAEVEEDTLRMKLDESLIKRTLVRSRCDQCPAYFSGWHENCPKDDSPLTVSIGNRIRVVERTVSDPHVVMYSGREVFLERDVSIVVLQRTSSELDARLSNFFRDAAVLFKAEPMNIGLLDDERPFAVFAAPTPKSH